jgi:hypothetical protein
MVKALMGKVLLRLASLSILMYFTMVTIASADELAVSLASITSPVHPGGTVTLIVKTEPEAICHGKRQVHSGDETELSPATLEASKAGTVQWSWKVLPGRNPVGSRTVDVSCTKGERDGALQAVWVVR